MADTSHPDDDLSMAELLARVRSMSSAKHKPGSRTVFDSFSVDSHHARPKTGPDKTRCGYFDRQGR